MMAKLTELGSLSGNTIVSGYRIPDVSEAIDQVVLNSLDANADVIEVW